MTLEEHLKGSLSPKGIVFHFSEESISVHTQSGTYSSHSSSNEIKSSSPYNKREIGDHTGQAAECTDQSPALEMLKEASFGGTCISGEGNGNPLQCSCLENPWEGGAWWAAVYGVTQSWTRLE